MENQEDILKNIKGFILAGIDKKTAIHTVLKAYNQESEDYISKYEVLIDTQDDKSKEIINPLLLKKVNMPSQMIFKAGTWRGSNKEPVTTTKEDLEDAVRCYQETKDNFTPIQKFTHKEKKEHSQDPILYQYPFRLGELTNLKMVNDELWAERKNVPELFVEMIKQGLITGHSAEFKNNVTINGQKYKRFLYADAFLGSQLPALAPVMQPFIYNDDENDSFNYEYELSVSYDSDFIQYENQEVNQMNKKAYEAKMQKCSDAGMKDIKTFEVFIELPENEQNDYMSKVEGFLNKKSDKGMYSDEQSSINIVSDNSELETLKAKLREYEEKARYDAEQEAKVKYDAEIQALKEANAEIQLKLANEELQREKEANAKFVYSFTKNPNGPILPISMEADLISMFNNMDKPLDSTFKYSNDGQEVEGNIKGNVQAVLKKLANELNVSGYKKNNKSVYSLDEYSETERGDKVKFTKKDDKINYSDEQTMEYLSDDDAIQKYADEKGISYEQAFDKYYQTTPSPVEEAEKIKL